MNRRLVLRLSIFVLGIGFLVFGVLRGEAMEVLQKATMVCFSCIGIG